LKFDFQTHFYFRIYPSGGRVLTSHSLANTIQHSSRIKLFGVSKHKFTANTCVSVLRKQQSYNNSLHVSPYFTSLHIVHVTFLKLARHLIIAISLQISTSLGILIRTDAAGGMVFTMNIYRTFQTVSSHPAPRVNECPHRNVTSVDAVTPCAPFVSKDAIVPK